MPVGQPIDTLVRGGLLVTGQQVQRADVAIGNGVVQAVGPDLSAVRAGKTIDAQGKLVLPGVVDAHVHPTPIERVQTLSEAAAHGGITTIMPFVSAFPSAGATGTLVEEVERFQEEAGRTSYLDFAVHASLGQADDHQRAIPALARMGVISTKMYMTYPRRGMMLTDDIMLRVMEATAASGGIAMVHAENGHAIDYLVDKFLAEGRKTPEDFPPTQPNCLEVEAIFRAATLAELVACPLYVVHLSARESVPLVRQLRQRNPRLYIETCPQYLLLTDEEMTRRGRLAKMGPPLRKREDNAALWEGLREGAIDTIASDSVGTTIEGKVMGGTTSTVPQPDNIHEARFGVPGVEWMLTALYDAAVNRGKLPLCRLVQALCENPARIFGLYPRKGTLQVGSDADLVVFDPSVRHTISASRQHGKSNFTLFEGRECLGAPVLVMQRGHVIVDNGELKAKPGQGQFLRGQR